MSGCRFSSGCGTTTSRLLRVHPIAAVMTRRPSASICLLGSGPPGDGRRDWRWIKIPPRVRSRNFRLNGFQLYHLGSFESGRPDHQHDD
jgi:hypothetical protein